MTDRITFYHNPISRGRIVHWMLEETGAPYDTKVVRGMLRKSLEPRPAFEAYLARCSARPAFKKISA